MSDFREKLADELKLIREFLKVEGVFWMSFLKSFWGGADWLKNQVLRLMYRQRGRFSQSFINASMAFLFFVVITFSGTLESLVIDNSGDQNSGSNYLLAAADQTGANTLVSNLPKGEITEYRVQDGDTVSSIAQKFGVSIDTIMWENSLKSVDAIKPKQILMILPVTGVDHKVKRGETIYSIAKDYQVDAQNIIDYPFNSFANDETFALSAGQDLIIPDGIKPNEVIIDTQQYVTKTVATPIAGVVGEGKFIWPTNGIITQKFSWYHQADDIANRSNPPIVAAQSGTVVTAGWNAGGYGNYVVIDHGNGWKTLYAHMLNNSVLVKVGQKVNQGQQIGTMGSTGRSTGTHLHFEIKGPNGNINPLTVLP
jgi:murein DD-endopeptidase MepM/ murein hydrolase activator NlpD